MDEHFNNIMTKDTTQEAIKKSDRRQDHESNARTCGLDFSISFHLFSACVQLVCASIFCFIYFSACVQFAFFCFHHHDK